jgi:hypothetical protein
VVLSVGTSVRKMQLTVTHFLTVLWVLLVKTRHLDACSKAKLDSLLFLTSSSIWLAVLFVQIFFSSPSITKTLLQQKSWILTVELLKPVVATIAVMLLIKLVIAQPVVQPSATTVVAKDIWAVNAQKGQRTRLATNVVNQVTFPAIVSTHQLRVRVVAAAVVDSLPVVARKSATSAAKLAISPETALKEVLLDMVATRVAMEVDTEVVVVVDLEVDVVKDLKPATHVVVMVTCLATALKAKSVITVASRVIYQETAQSSQPMSVLATSASNLVTFRLNAQTRPVKTTYMEDRWANDDRRWRFYTSNRCYELLPSTFGR